MVVSDLETQSVWVLNAAMTAWIIVGPRVIPHDLHYTTFGGMVADTVVGQQLFSRHERPNHPFAGVTLFKTGFGGRNLDVVHCTDIPLNIRYYGTRFLENVRKWRRGF
jgi:hypothetical protein